MPQQEEVLDFKTFLKVYYPNYVIDTVNERIIKDLNLYANRDEKFNGRPKTPDGDRSNWHIDRGIALVGPVGSGKDELIRHLRYYMRYLRSPYGFSFKVVWKFASEFSKEKVGYNAFANESQGNIYYEELCLTDDDGLSLRTAKRDSAAENGDIVTYPNREVGQHFGKKVLVGAEIIKLRYDAWKYHGWITHFSTNENESNLEAIYGHRMFSRLEEMCNIMYLIGPNRRKFIAPAFVKNNVNSPTAPAPREVSVDEQIENKRRINEEYTRYCTSGQSPDTGWLTYKLLLIYGVQLSDDDEMRQIMDDVAPTYTPSGKLKISDKREVEADRKTYIWAETQRRVVILFFERMKKAGAKSIFDQTEFVYVFKHKKVGATDVAEVLNSATGIVPDPPTPPPHA